WLNPCRVRHRKDLGHKVRHYFACVVARRDLPILRVSQRGYRVQRAVPDQLRPQFAFNIIVGDAAGYASALEEARETLGLGIAGTNDEIAAAHMSDLARRRHG